MTNRPDVSVVMVSYNTRELLEKSLRSLYAQSPSLALQVIVVDNASSDGSVDMLRQKFPEVCLVANEQNLGISKANNQGLRLCCGRYALLLNPDTLILDRAIERMKGYLEANPRVGAVTPRLLNADGSYQRSDYPAPSLIGAFYLYSGLFEKLPALGRRLLPEIASPNPNETRSVSFCATACFLVSQKCLDSVGLFDERFFLYSDDTDWCRRIRQKGWNIVYLAEAEVVHYEGAAMTSGKISFLNPNTSRARRRQRILNGEIIYLGKWHGLLYAKLYYWIVWGLSLYGLFRASRYGKRQSELTEFWKGESDLYRSVLTNRFRPKFPPPGPRSVSKAEPEAPQTV